MAVLAVETLEPQPTTTPNFGQYVHSDASECSFTNLKTLMPPMPTGAASDAIQSMLSTLQASCTMLPAERPTTNSCASQIPTGRCAAPSLVLSSMRPALASYGSSALDWWTAHGSVLPQVVTSYWDSWRHRGTNSMLEIIGIAGIAACYGNFSEPALTPAAPSLSTASGSAAASPTASPGGPVSTAESNVGSNWMQSRRRCLLFVAFVAATMSLL